MGRNTSFGDSVFYDNSDDPEFEEGLVFVIMPFSSQLNDVYSAMKDECSKLSLDCVRVDEVTGSGFILKKIYDLIERAEFIIADLTEERPNVYYEIGYAHGVGNEGNEILLIAKEGTKLHFDIAPLAVRFYSSTEHLRSIVNSHLGMMIKDTR